MPQRGICDPAERKITPDQVGNTIIQDNILMLRAQMNILIYCNEKLAAKNGPNDQVIDICVDGALS